MLVSPEYRGKIALTDGGVYDNLGLETAWKRCGTVLISDGGGHIPDGGTPFFGPLTVRVEWL